MTTQSVYLLQTREFINAKQNVYKIGRTTKDNYIRFTQYPKGSILLFQSSCYDCRELERRIIKHFKLKYTVKCMIGREYFEGNRREMIKDMCDLIRNEEHAEDDVGNDDVDTNITEVIQCEEVTQENSANVQCEEVIQNSSAVIQCEEVIQNKVVDTNIVIKNVVNINEDSECDESDENKEIENSKKKFNCDSCNYSTNRSSNLKKHYLSKKHSDTINTNALQDVEEEYNKLRCKVCRKVYRSNQGLWGHKKKCDPPKIAIVPTNLHMKIDNLERIIVGIAKKMEAH
jgi:Zinc-finger of C2H2 type